ncbi:hypothetical protein FA13DRAFT_1747848 [Coprinellus micaceus]|uniref:Uncharacterized protein n=1 Tax=Coprinellus micaceus TaxID=71717 RepID=A0A4Y7S114_COPMI|nr:hypothetical protein FA13DRAFT_1747848 [Coprinellus micaceus]
MRVPSFVSKLLKRKKAKPEQAPIDEYERAIIESPATPPESDSSVEAPVSKPLAKYDNSWRFVDRPRATPHLMADVSWDSNKAHYGGSDSSRETYPSSGDAIHQEQPPREGKVRRLNLSKSRTSQPPTLLTPMLVPQSPLPGERGKTNGQMHIPSRPDSGERDRTNEDGNQGSFPPLLRPPHSPREVKAVVSGHEHDSSAIGQVAETLKPHTKSQSSFGIPLSWESLEALDPSADGIDDLAIARRVEQMTSPATPIASTNRESPSRRTASAGAEHPADLALVGETPDSSSLASLPIAPAEEDTGSLGNPGPARSPSPPLTPLANSGSCPSPASPIARFPLTPPNSRPSSAIHSPVEALRVPPPSPQTPFGSPLKCPLPLTPTEYSKFPVISAGDGYSSNATRTETGAGAYPNAYPTPNSSLGKK